MPSGSTMATIAQRGRLIAGVDQGKYLAGYRDPQTGELRGSDIDLVHTIARAILADLPYRGGDEVAVLVNRLFEDDWKARAAEAKKPERAFETATRPARSARSATSRPCSTCAARPTASSPSGLRSSPTATTPSAR